MPSGIYDHTKRRSAPDCVGEEYQAGATMRQLANKYDCSAGAVRNSLKRLGITSRDHCRYTPDEQANIANEHGAGLSLASLGRKYGIGPDTVRRYAAAAGVPLGGTGRNGGTPGLPLAVGTMIGVRTITREATRDPGGQRRYFWICGACDTERGPTRMYTLKRSVEAAKGPINSCKACEGLNTGREKSYRWTGHKDLPGTYFASIRAGAVSRKLEFSITIEDMWNQWETQDGICAYSGVRLSLPSGRKFDTTGTGSIDRIDSTIGYLKTNIHWIHKEINRMKWDLSNDQFLEWCRLIAVHSADI